MKPSEFSTINFQLDLDPDSSTAMSLILYADGKLGAGLPSVFSTEEKQK